MAMMVMLLMKYSNKQNMQFGFGISWGATPMYKKLFPWLWLPEIPSVLVKQ